MAAMLGASVVGDDGDGGGGGGGQAEDATEVLDVVCALLCASTT
jgi:hypothetical protein